MGNIATMPLDELWQTATFDLYRKRLSRSVRGGLCSNCDFDGFRDPFLAGGRRPLTRDEFEKDPEERL
jgi:hypothetical protein